MTTSDLAPLSAGRLRTAPAILFEAARLAPDRVRLTGPAGEVTLCDLADRVAAFAARLAGAGVGTGDRVALFGDNGVDWLVAALAVQARGAAWAGIHAGSSAELAVHVVQHSGARVAVASRAELERSGAELPVPAIPLEEAGRAAAASWRDLSRLDLLACLIYTSGTTGRPKGVMLTHRNLAVNGRDWIAVNAAALPEAPRELLWLPMSHVFGWGAAVVGTLMGFHSHLVPPSRVADELPRVRPHVLMTVPLLLERLARSARDDQALCDATGGALRLCLAGGAPLSPAIKARFRAAGVPLREGYGLSETSPTLTLERGDEASLETVGRPYPSAELAIAPDGEILARGPSVFAGYWDDQAATARAIDLDGWFHTGDLGRFTADGCLVLAGRKKELIALASGKKIAPAEIEARAAEDPWIDRLVLFGEGSAGLVALVSPDLASVARDLGHPLPPAGPGADPDAARGFAGRIEALNQRLSRFERIRAFAVLPEPLSVARGHLTASLKVRRHAVEAEFRPLLASLYQEIAR